MTTETLIDPITSTIRKMDDLVDAHWGPGALFQPNDRTCLVGLVGYALKGHNGFDYGLFYADDSRSDPRALELLSHVAESIPETFRPDVHEPVERVYVWNDEKLRTRQAVHQFLQGLL